MKRGEIYYIHMRPTVGAELEKVQAERDRYARMLDMLLAEREGAQ